MPEPRELLDAYAAEERDFGREWGKSDREELAPDAFDALRSVLDAVDTWRHEAWQPSGTGDYTAGYVAGALAATFAHEDKIRRVIAEKLGGDHARE